MATEILEHGRGGEALRRFIPSPRAGSGLTVRSTRLDDRRCLAIWLKHEWHGWSGCLYPYVAILITAPFLYYLSLNPHPSLIAAFVSGGGSSRAEPICSVYVKKLPWEKKNYKRSMMESRRMNVLLKCWPMSPHPLVRRRGISPSASLSN
jgi:hypothetical protein